VLKFLEFTVFIEKIDAYIGAFPACQQAGILAAFLLLVYLIARLDSLDGRLRPFIRQFRLVCLWGGAAPL
jgi:hypothetical protein